MKTHLYRSSRSTWCGREIAWEGFPVELGGLASSRVTRDHSKATCKVCLKANAAEQRKEDAASK